MDGAATLSWVRTGATSDLVAVLQAVIREDQEEIRVRMAFLAKKYADVISDSKAAD